MRRAGKPFATCVQTLVIAFLILYASGAICLADVPPGLPFLTDYSSLIADLAIWAIAQDGDGVVYLATGGGVLEYDGISIRQLPLANGSIARSLAVHDSGAVYVGGIGKVGVLRRDATGWLSYSPLHDPEGRHLEGLRDVWHMWPTESGFIAWARDRVLAWDSQAFELFETIDEMLRK